MRRELIEEQIRYVEVDTESPIPMLLITGRQARVRAMVDLYNAFNSNAATQENSFLEDNFAPQAIVPGRLAKFAVQIDF